MDFYQINRSSVCSGGMVLVSTQFCFGVHYWSHRIHAYICGNYNFVTGLENLALKKVQKKSPNNLLGFVSSKHNSSYWILYLHLCIRRMVHCIILKDQRLGDDWNSKHRLSIDGA